MLSDDRERQRITEDIAVVPLAGLEPARCCHHLILSQARLPIPPQGPRADYSGGRAGVNAAWDLPSPGGGGSAREARRGGVK